jgi:hypothetical protein
LQGAFFPARDARTVCGQDTRDICNNTSGETKEKHVKERCGAVTEVIAGWNYLVARDPQYLHDESGMNWLYACFVELKLIVHRRRALPGD